MTPNSLRATRFSSPVSSPCEGAGRRGGADHGAAAPTSPPTSTTPSSAFPPSTPSAGSGLDLHHEQARRKAGLPGTWTRPVRRRVQVARQAVIDPATALRSAFKRPPSLADTATAPCRHEATWRLTARTSPPTRRAVANGHGQAAESGENAFLIPRRSSAGPDQRWRLEEDRQTADSRHASDTGVPYAPPETVAPGSGPLQNPVQLSVL